MTKKTSAQGYVLVLTYAQELISENEVNESVDPRGIGYTEILNLINHVSPL